MLNPGVLLVLVASVALFGCEQGDFLAEGPARECREVGAQCVLPDGPLGVCESIPCETGKEPPCLVCVSQH
jgi:hypothetical protein